MFLKVDMYYGVGDAIVIGYVLAGLIADNPNEEVKLIVQRTNSDKQDWLDLITTNTIPAEAVDCGPGAEIISLFNGFGDKWYDLELNGTTRHESWAGNACTKPIKYTLNIPDSSIEFAANFLSTRPNCVILSPFTRSQVRQWPVSYYQELAVRLGDLGVNVLINPSTLMTSACCGTGDVPDVTAFSKFEMMPSESPADVAALISMSSMVIGGDCGYCHIAGVLGKDAIAITSSTDGEKIFGFYDTVKVVRVLHDCAHCYMPFKAPLAVHCQGGCPLLKEITAESVYKIVYDKIINGVFTKDTISQIGVAGLPK